MPENLDYSVIIPVYNSTSSLTHLAQRCGDVFKKLQKSYEMILVDDGSPNPATWPAIVQLCATDTHVRAIQHSRNFGQHAAFFCGLKHAKGKFVITMDDDGEHRPEDIPLLIAEDAHDVVMAYPKNVKRRLTSRIKMRIERWIFGLKQPLIVTAFTLFPQAVAQHILALRTPHPLLSAAQFYVTGDVVNVPVEAATRLDSVSGYNFFKRLKLFGALIFNHSSVLLRGVGILGIGLCGISILAAAFILYRKLSGEVMPGWSSIMVTLLFFNGVILFALGIVGEYLLRIVSAAEQKPTSIIRRTLNLDV